MCNIAISICASDEEGTVVFGGVDGLVDDGCYVFFGVNDLSVDFQNDEIFLEASFAECSVFVDGVDLDAIVEMEAIGGSFVDGFECCTEYGVVGYFYDICVA